MTKREFTSWLNWHNDRFPVRDLFADSADLQASWFRILSDVTFAEAKAASDALLSKGRPEFKTRQDDARLVRDEVFAARAAAERAKPWNNDHLDQYRGPRATSEQFRADMLAVIAELEAAGKDATFQRKLLAKCEAGDRKAAGEEKPKKPRKRKAKKVEPEKPKPTKHVPVYEMPAPDDVCPF